MLKLMIGKAGTGKTAAVINEIKQAVDSGQPGRILLVPEQYSHEAERELCAGIGREFVHLLETTDMTKVYKMPVLRAFYNDGQVRMAVSEEQLLTSWRDFFNDGTNWKDLKKDITLAEFRAISDKAHLSNILRNPVKFLKASGRGFYVERDGYPIALAVSLADVVKNAAFIAELKDIIEYRTMEYYRSRYEAKAEV